MAQVLKTGCKYDLACVTSMGVRITPMDRMPVHTADYYMMQATSAETNVLNVAASLGMECLALTKFVEGSPIAAFIKSELGARGIKFEGPDVAQGGPWGYRHQFNIADSGYGLRAPRVWNDRAGEVGQTISAGDFDAERIFGEEGVKILHLSGLIAALSRETTECCLELARAAKKHGTLVSFDLNYRESFWQGREEELRSAFGEIAASADILIGNEEDFQLCLSIEGPETGGRKLSDKIQGFKDMIARAQNKYTNASMFATTLRQVISANEHLWGAMICAGGDWHIEEPRQIPVMDRIGGGDGFAGGLLYGILKGYEPDDLLRLGWAAGALAVSGLKDYAEPADEKQLRDIYDGNARVQR